MVSEFSGVLLGALIFTITLLLLILVCPRLNMRLVQEKFPVRKTTVQVQEMKMKEMIPIPFSKYVNIYKFPVENPTEEL